MWTLFLQNHGPLVSDKAGPIVMLRELPMTASNSSSERWIALSTNIWLNCRFCANNAGQISEGGSEWILRVCPGQRKPLFASTRQQGWCSTIVFRWSRFSHPNVYLTKISKNNCPLCTFSLPCTVFEDRMTGPGKYVFVSTRTLYSWIQTKFWIAYVIAILCCL